MIYAVYPTCPRLVLDHSSLLTRDFEIAEHSMSFNVRVSATLNDPIVLSPRRHTVAPYDFCKTFVARRPRIASETILTLEAR